MKGSGTCREIDGSCDHDHRIQGAYAVGNPGADYWQRAPMSGIVEGVKPHYVRSISMMCNEQSDARDSVLHLLAA